MIIYCLEDSGSSLLCHAYLRDVHKHKVKSTDDYRDIAEWIAENPDGFDALILDLNMPLHSLRYIPGCKDYDKEKNHSPTLYFIEKFLLVRFPYLRKKIILFSAFFDDYYIKGCKEQLEQFIKIDKNERNYLNDLIFAIDSLNNDG